MCMIWPVWNDVLWYDVLCYAVMLWCRDDDWLNYFCGEPVLSSPCSTGEITVRYIRVVTVAMTTQGRGNRSASKFLRLEISNIIYLCQYCIIISERENVVLNIDISWTSNVTCGKFEHCRDSNVNVMVFCCENEVWKTPNVRVLGGAAGSHKGFHRGRENSRIDPKWWIHLLVVPVFQCLFIISGIRDLVMLKFRKNNERFSDPV